MRGSHRDYDEYGVWVDFNSLDFNGCWVTGGPNATCPYSNSLSEQDELKKKVILVSGSCKVMGVILKMDRSPRLQLLLF